MDFHESKFFCIPNVLMKCEVQFILYNSLQEPNELIWAKCNQHEHRKVVRCRMEGGLEAADKYCSADSNNRQVSLHGITATGAQMDSKQQPETSYCDLPGTISAHCSHGALTDCKTLYKTATNPRTTPNKQCRLNVMR